MAQRRMVTLGVLAIAVAAGAVVFPAVIASASGPEAPEQAPKAKRFELTQDLTWADDDASWKKIRSQLGRKSPVVQSDEWHNGALKPGEAKDRIVVIDFWATWCGPCKAAVPHTNKLMETYRDKGVTVIGVCNKDGSDKMGQVVKSTGMKFPTARDKSGRIAQDFGVQWWPYYVVVDRKGIVRAAGLRTDTVKAVVDALLEEQPPEPSGQ